MSTLQSNGTCWVAICSVVEVMMTSRSLLARPLTLGVRRLSALIVAEHDGARVSEGTLAAVTAAAPLGPVQLLVGGEGCKVVAEGAGAVAGVSSVVYAESAALSNGVAEEWTPVILAAREAGGHTHVVAAASAFSKSVLPRVAAKLDVAKLSDVLEVKSPDSFVRPIYAGNALSTVTSVDEVKVLTVRPTVFEKAAREGGSADVQPLDSSPAVNMTTWISEEVKKSDRPDLASAKTVRPRPIPEHVQTGADALQPISPSSHLP